MQPKRFRVLNERKIDGMTYASVGDVVYDLLQCDYGGADDDTRITGVKHCSVTKEPNGSYPFFTIPVSHLAALEDAAA